MFTPRHTNYVGLLPVLLAAKQIIEEDFAEAMAWRCSLDSSQEGPAFARIQTAQMQSLEYPCLVIQPAEDTPAKLGAGGINQVQLFDVEIYLARSIDEGNPVDQLLALTSDLIRYYDAVRWALECATKTQWKVFYPTGANAGDPQATCKDAIFGQIEKGEAESVNSQYARSVGFELEIKFTEAEG